MAKHVQKPSQDHDEENLEKLKAAYKELQEKYSLPDFDELDEEFEIRKTDYDSFVIKEVRRSILQKIDYVIALLEPIVDPKHSLHSFVETKIFEKHNIETMFAFYKKLWHIVHKGIHAAYVDEKAEAEFIKDIWKEWPEIKKSAAGYAKQIADGWAKVEKEIFSDRYLQ